MTEERIFSAIDKIEPSKDAEKRMYDNILKKAKGTGSEFKILRIIKPAVSVAACVCLVAAAAVLLRTEINNSGGFSGAADDSTESLCFDAAENEAAIILTTTLSGFIYNEGENVNEVCEAAPAGNAMKHSEEQIADVMEDGEDIADEAYVIESTRHFTNTAAPEKEADIALTEITAEEAGLWFNIPEKAKSITYGENENKDADFQTGSFILDDHVYSFVVYELEENSDLSAQEEEFPTAELIMNYPEANAVLYSFENGETVGFKTCWENETRRFCLTNSDGADKKEVIDVLVEVVEIN